MSQALQFLILTAAAWLNRQQEDTIDYPREENRAIREQLAGKRIRMLRYDGANGSADS